MLDFLNSARFQILRFGINGVIATGVHYGVLTLNMTVFKIPSAGIANLVAAVFGISVSFLGNRYFVFQNKETGLIEQLVKFSLLYGLLAVMHGAVMFFWADVFHFDYRFGFLAATGVQVVVSYFGSKRLVFKK